MFLSKITLQPRLQQMTEKDIIEFQSFLAKGIYGYHQLLWKLFAGQQPRQFVFRHSVDKQGLNEFYLLSAVEPKPSRFFDIQTKAFQPKLQSGQLLGYQLRVNPTVCIKDRQHDVLMNAKKNAKDQGIKEDSQQLKQRMEQAAHSWLSDKERLARWGFQVETAEISDYRQHRCLKKIANDRHYIRFSSVDFQGILRITDSERFLQQYAKGFGRAKAFGCGLMLIRPI